MSVPEPTALLPALNTAAARAYAPYSGFHVGAVAVGQDGTLYSGANLENASYGVTICAEVSALAAANLAGAMGRLVAVAVIGGKPDAAGALGGSDPVMPCGRCRQMLFEASRLSGRDLPIHSFSGDGTQLRTRLISELLPDAFGPDAID